MNHLLHVPGVDETTAVTLQYEDGAIAQFLMSTRTELDSSARIVGSEGSIEVGHFSYFSQTIFHVIFPVCESVTRRVICYILLLMMAAGYTRPVSSCRRSTLPSWLRLRCKRRAVNTTLCCRSSTTSIPRTSSIPPGCPTRPRKSAVASLPVCSLVL